MSIVSGEVIFVYVNYPVGHCINQCLGLPIINNNKVGGDKSQHSCTEKVSSRIIPVNFPIFSFLQFKNSFLDVNKFLNSYETALNPAHSNYDITVM